MLIATNCAYFPINLISTTPFKNPHYHQATAIREHRPTLFHFLPTGGEDLDGAGAGVSFFGAFFLGALFFCLGASFWGTSFPEASFFGSGFSEVSFLGVSFLGAASLEAFFFRAASSGASFLGALFFGVVFFVPGAEAEAFDYLPLRSFFSFRPSAAAGLISSARTVSEVGSLSAEALARASSTKVLLDPSGLISYLALVLASVSDSRVTADVALFGWGFGFDLGLPRP